MTVIYQGHTTTEGNADLDAIIAAAAAEASVRTAADALLAAVSFMQWGPTKPIGSFVARAYTYNGGTAIVAGAAAQIAGGSVTVADNMVNYVERTYAGVVSVNQVGFTSGNIPMAKVTAAANAITAVEDWRPMLGPFPYYAPLAGEIGVTDPRYLVGDLRRYGATGGADDTTALNNALASLYALGGGTLWVAAKYIILGQITIPNNGASTPVQPPIRITGPSTGNAAGETGVVPDLAGVLDLRYSGANAKILTLGLGSLEIDHVYLQDNGASSTPFLMTTNTTVKAHHNRVDGNLTKAQLTCDQDFIVCGGTTKVTDGTVNAPFQGYGTVIEQNCFNRIRRGLYGQMYANAIVFRDNWFLHQCGTNLANGAAVEFVGDAIDRDTGNLIIGNQVEIFAYPYFVKLTNAVQNQIVFNSLFDPSGTTIAGVRVETASMFNLVIPGYSAGSKPALSEVANGSTTVYQHDQSQPSVFQAFLTNGALSAFTDGYSPFVKNSAGDAWNSTIAGTNGTTQDWGYTPVATGVRGQGMALTQVSATDWRLRMMGTTGNRVESLVGPMDIRTLAGQSLILGDTAKFMNITNGILGSNVTAGTAVFALSAKINAVTGSRGANAALASLLTALATAGLITDNSTI